MRQRLESARAAALFDTYGACLTTHQQEAYRLVYDEDWSLSEVAALLGVSRAAAGDLVARATRQLLRLETALGMVAMRNERAHLLRALVREIGRAEPAAVRAELVKTAQALAALEGLEPDV